MRKNICKEFTLVSRNGNEYFCFNREMKLRVATNELIPLVIINAKKGHQRSRAIIHYDNMNDVMRKSVMKNFKAWCIQYIKNSLYFGHTFAPDSDIIIEF